MKKGRVDIISNGRQVLLNDSEGSMKRCGGVGDLLTGTLGTFIHWCHQRASQNVESDSSNDNRLAEENEANLMAALAGSIFIRECSRAAFDKSHRSMLAIDIIERMGETFYEMFDKKQ